MDPAAAVAIVAIVLIILAIVVFLLAVIVELRKITIGLDVVIPRVAELVTKTRPVNELVDAINVDLTAGTELLEGLLVKKAGVEDGAGLIESLFPGAGVAFLARHGRRGKVKNISEVYSRGAGQLVRLGRESPLGSPMSGEALRDAVNSSAAARSLYYRPGGPDARPRSPTIGVDAPVVFGPGAQAGNGAPPASTASPPEPPAASEHHGSSKEGAVLRWGKRT